ncbi:uncharacterized protein LOC119077393 [Bradysia coprophila]|uniref:uncharacterized protein LOC119067047 n=1 Tax=Bradysia coprophila TaxID=38358 RepID=UPI00187DBD04|nr:uncharacterized protein LOC119067047 [Bradysia coprophila]XP_037040491.1 uncharacterized protein LOC119077393 [Bradysia coprophila]
MPLTNAERRKKYVEKLKANGEYESFKQKKAASEKARRDRLKIGLDKLPKAEREKVKRVNRTYMRKKVAEYRQRKKGLPVEKTGTSSNASNLSEGQSEAGYKTTSALHKAVAKLKRALPSTSGKKKEAVSKLLLTFDENDQSDIARRVSGVKTRPTRALSSGITDSVISFYERDDVSRMSPNMRDCRKFVDPKTGVKEEKQIRYLMYKLSDVYDMFVRHFQNGDDTMEVPLKLTKFTELRPNHVKLVNQTPLETCFCIHHSNFIMCCQALNRYLPEFPQNGPELERLLICDKPKKNCWLRSCSVCSDSQIRKLIEDIVKRSGVRLKSQAKWTQWRKNDETNRFQKYVIPGKLSDLQSYFMNIMPEFLKHTYTKRSQAATFEKDTQEVRKSKGRIALIQIDFAECFNCEAQEEVQSAHWNQATV